VPANPNSPAAQGDALTRDPLETYARGRRKAAPEQPSHPIINRPRLFRHLDEVLARRLTFVLADAGYGKSVLLGAWAATAPSIWYGVDSGDASLSTFVLGIASSLRRRLPAVSRQLRLVMRTSVAQDGDALDRVAPIVALLCDALEQELREELVLVFDDIHELGRRGPAVRLLEQLCREAPTRLHVVLSSRLELPFPVQRLRGRGEVLDLDAALLAFTEDEVAELLVTTLGEDAESLAPAVQEMTAGWPAAVRLTVEALRLVPPTGRPAALEALRRPSGRLFDYVAEEVFGRASPGVRQLLRHVAPFERFSADLCKALGINAASDSLSALRRAGLFLETRRGESEWFGLHGLVREFVRDRWPLDESEQAAVHRRAASWFCAHDAFDDALKSLVEIGDLPAIADVLEAHGPELLAGGNVESTIRTAGLLPRGLRTGAIERLVGEAHEIRGEWDEALECFERAAGGSEQLEAGLAWRLGLIHHLCGRLDEALEVYERGQLVAADPRDAALLLAWKASSYWLRGDADRCREAAQQAFTQAGAAGDPGALAAAHTVLAMLAAMTGDRLSNDAHYLRALEYAERAGDLLQAVRVRTNRGSQHLEEGEYEEALAELEIATRLGELTGFTFFRALALNNRGQAHFHLGRLEEATADLEASKALYQRAGSRMVSYPLASLGDVHRERGDLASAQAHYEEALARAEESGDVQGLVPALAGLAHVLSMEDPDRARAFADRAVSCGEGMAQVAAWLAAGWVALIRGERKLAVESAEKAAATARLRRDRAGLAESLELVALAIDDCERRVIRLEEAISLWRGIGNPLGQARAELILGLTGGGASGRARAEEAESRLHAIGAHGPRMLVAAALPSTKPAPRAAITVTALGRFGVARDAWPVGREEWQSKKARDLLKILIARRGRPTPRDVLMEALWPEQDPRRVSNRLSVALSTLRAVLDPERRYPTDHFLLTDGEAIVLQLANVDVDVETFLEEAEHGLELRARGRTGEARRHLETAEGAYRGDFLEEDLYEDWATPLRERARSLYVTVAGTLAEIADGSQEGDTAMRYRLRILERDPYDESAHLGVVKALLDAGRHGEARRAYRDYVGRMDELDVEAAPFPRSRSTAVALSSRAGAWRGGSAASPTSG
jgi:DNA-binding SARP family transcriptional activator